MTTTDTSKSSDVRQRIEAIVETVIAGRAMYVVDVVVRGRPGSQVVDVFVDSGTGILVDDLARLNREIGFLLETEDLLKGAYRLNVSSPGADRPLRVPRQFTRHVGRKLDVRLRSGQPSATTETQTDSTAKAVGTLKGLDENGIYLETATGQRFLSFDDIEEASVVLPW